MLKISIYCIKQDKISRLREVIAGLTRPYAGENGVILAWRLSFLPEKITRLLDECARPERSFRHFRLDIGNYWQNPAWGMGIPFKYERFTGRPRLPPKWKRNTRRAWDIALDGSLLPVRERP